MYCPKLNITICTIRHEVKFSIIRHIFLLMYLLSHEISIREPKNASKVCILNEEGLALNGPMKGLG
jgi:hypothetical protein